MSFTLVAHFGDTVRRDCLPRQPLPQKGPIRFPGRISSEEGKKCAQHRTQVRILQHREAGF